MDFNYSARTEHYISRVRAFMDFAAADIANGPRRDYDVRARREEFPRERNGAIRTQSFEFGLNSFRVN